MKVAHFEDKPGRHEREERKAYIAAVLMANPGWLIPRLTLTRTCPEESEEAIEWRVASGHPDPAPISVISCHYP